MKRIGVINNMKVILPCEMDAVATIYEVEDGKMVREKERRDVDTLIMIQQETFNTDYPPNEEYIWSEYKRLDELICGEIEGYLEKALTRLGIRVIRNVYGWMDTFETDYIKGQLKKLEDRPPRRATARDIMSYVFKVWPDLQDIGAGYFEMEPDIPDVDKLWMLDHWADSRAHWSVFDVFIRIFDLPIDLQRALKYAERFLLVDKLWMQVRCEDGLFFQKEIRHQMELLLAYVDPSVKQRFIDECLIMAVKNRLILIVELLMDAGADIGYVNKRGCSVKSVEKKLLDPTLLSYLKYYREHGRKDPAVDPEKLFVRKKGDSFERYRPEILVDGVADVAGILDKHVDEVGKKTLFKYGKVSYPEPDSSGLEMENFINRYDWRDGPSVPHIIANHKNCTRDLVRKMYAFAERRLENTDDKDEKMILLWKCFMSELGRLHEFLDELERWG